VRLISGGFVLTPPEFSPHRKSNDISRPSQGRSVKGERTEGKTAYAIARDLNKDAVPTAQGARARYFPDPLR
jgi:hypothetical protein